MQEIKLPLEEPYRCLLVDFLNLVFGDSMESTVFWNTSIKHYMHLKFCYSINRSVSNIFIIDEIKAYKQLI